MKTLLYPGSFDPVTLGHMDIIRRSSVLCETLVVAVMHNPEKRGAIPAEQRAELLRRACSGIPNVRVILHAGLMVDCAHALHADAVVRGLRPLGDFDSEFTMAQFNRRLGGTETIFLPTTEGLSGVSSSAVRQVASFGGSIAGMVPAELEQDILSALRKD